MTIEDLRLKITQDPQNIGYYHYVEGLTAGEYKDIALLALKTLCDGYPLLEHGIMEAQALGIISEKMDCEESNRYWAAHVVSKNIFEGQSVFDPYSDDDFIAEAARICPHYISRYTKGE